MDKFGVWVHGSHFIDIDKISPFSYPRLFKKCAIGGDYILYWIFYFFSYEPDKIVQFS